MSELPTRIPAVHDWHLRQVLEELKLLPALESGELQCAVCGAGLALASVGGILVVGKERFSLVCNRVACLELAGKQE